MYGEYDYSDFDGSFFVFIGQNASTGEPHHLTGRMSFFGRYYGGFGSRQDAVAFAAAHDDGSPQTISVAGTARSLRCYSLGCSVQSYLTDLSIVSI